MKIKRYSNLYQITFLPLLFPINCYVLENKDSLLVIDMGVKGFAKMVKQIADKIGKPVTMLLLTHAHADHVNGVPLFRKLFPNAQVGISERDALLLEGDFNLKNSEPINEIKGGFSKAKILIDFTFKEHDRFNELEVISTPGHTPGSVSFFDHISKAIIVGDAFQIKGGLAVSGTLNWTFPFPALATWDPKTALKSAKKILKLDPTLLAVGHGSMLQKPGVKMERAIKKMEKKG